MVANAEAQARYAARQKALDPVRWAERMKAARRKSRTKDPIKNRARNRVYRAIKAGTLVRPDACEECGRSCRPEAAHKDYSRPLDVMWLCRKCHAVRDLGGKR